MQKPELLRRLEVAARRRRSALLFGLLKALRRKSRILDVGGTVEYWQSVRLPMHLVDEVVLLNTFDQQTSAPFKSVVGDARDLSRYKDGEFDVVFSNSVLGHVGTLEDQCKAASEIRRVGRYYLVQTPNHGFLVDWRTLVPFFHFLPANAQAWCFKNFSVGTYRRASCAAEAWHLATRVRNIRRAELAQLFPQATVVKEKVLGLTKSFMIHNFPGRLYSGTAFIWASPASSSLSECCAVMCYITASHCA
jgi:SAM-dependent methyltransferase